MKNLVKDLCLNLDIGSNIGGKKPIQFLTAWRLIGNSSVHTDPYLTSWKVEGNSVIGETDYPDGLVIPQGYKRCEYIESHGTEHIDLGFNNLYSYKLKAQCTQARNTFSIMIANGGSAGQYIGFSNAGVWTLGSTYVFGTDNSSPAEVDVTFSATQVEGTINNETVVREGSSVNSNFRLFTYTTANTTYNSYAKLWYLQCFEGNQMIHHWIPCLDDNEVPCLYDVIGQQTYYNLGEGTFGYKLLEKPKVIYSCGDYSDVDGKYHVKISNGVTIYDIPLTEPLRKVNDVSDSIEFADGVATVIRKNAFIRQSYDSDYYGYFDVTGNVFYTKTIPDIVRMTISDRYVIIICNKLETSFFDRMRNADIVAIGTFSNVVVFRNYEIEQTITAYKAWLATLGELDLIYQLETPTTEVIQVSPFPISPTDTYTSANVVPYSAFEYKKNVEIWSCGEYSAVDNKWHIRILPEGYGIVDIALDEPLRKVNDIADSIEFADGVATVTRNLASDDMGNFTWNALVIGSSSDYRMIANIKDAKSVEATNKTPNMLTIAYTATTVDRIYSKQTGVSINTAHVVQVYDPDYNQSDSAAAFKLAMAGVELIYELATPTTETIQVPQIEEADSYSMVISQGAKAVEWSSFTPNTE